MAVRENQRCRRRTISSVTTSLLHTLNLQCLVDLDRRPRHLEMGVAFHQGDGTVDVLGAENRVTGHLGVGFAGAPRGDTSAVPERSAEITPKTRR